MRFLVELLIEFAELLSDFLDVHESLVLSEDLDEADGDSVEVSGLLEACVEEADFLETDSGILGEHLEALGVSVELAEEFHVLENVVESGFLGGGGEEHSGVAAGDGVFLGRGLVVGGRLDLLHVTNSECLEERFIEVECIISSLVGSSEHIILRLRSFGIRYFSCNLRLLATLLLLR